MKKKLDLKKLKVQSFVTAMDHKEQQQMRGGADSCAECGYMTCGPCYTQVPNCNGGTHHTCGGGGGGPSNPEYTCGPANQC